MNKNTEIFGIDISKDVFDVYSYQKGHQSFKNDAQGFKSFLKVITKDALVVMEATGYYHYLFAQFLHKKKAQVSVVNPLSVKRFIQMKLAKVKTDKSDAKAICLGQMCLVKGDLNNALKWFSFDEKHAFCPWIRVLNLNKKLQQEDPRFLKLIREMNLPDPAPLIYTSI